MKKLLIGFLALSAGLLCEALVPTGLSDIQSGVERAVAEQARRLKEIGDLVEQELEGRPAYQNTGTNGGVDTKKQLSNLKLAAAAKDQTYLEQYVSNISVTDDGGGTAFHVMAQTWTSESSHKANVKKVLGQVALADMRKLHTVLNKKNSAGKTAMELAPEWMKCWFVWYLENSSPPGPPPADRCKKKVKKKTVRRTTSGSKKKLKSKRAARRRRR